MARASSDTGLDHIKVAVTLDNHDAFMGKYNPADLMESFIQHLCEYWNLSEPSNYMLQFKEHPNHYVSDANRHTFKVGVLLDLVVAAPVLCSEILATLTSNSSHQDKMHFTDLLNSHSSDPTFVTCFVNNKGIHKLMALLTSLSSDDLLLGPLLHAFTDLLNTAQVATRSQVDWEMCDEQFVLKIVLLVESRVGVTESLILRALVALENIVTNSRAWVTTVENRVNLLRLMEHLRAAKDPVTRVSVLRLVTALFSRAAPDRKMDYSTKLADRKYRACITDNLLHTVTVADGRGAAELCEQLHRLQQMLLNQLQPRLLTGVAPDDAAALEKIVELRNVVFEADAGVTGRDARHKEILKEYKKLGFKNETPAQDFNEVPPGVLALDTMHYFCTHHYEQYSKLVLENCYRADSHECPIGKASIELAKQLAIILKIGEDPVPGCTSFHPMLFTNDRPFEEMFCICISLLNKTWKEMKATTEDFSKVLSVVREQIKLALNKQPTNLDQFNKRLQELTYEKITQIWDRERMTTEEKGMNAPQIQKLKEELRRNIVEVVQLQRLRILEEGARFRNTARKSKYMFCRLSTNHKFFHHDDCDEKATRVPPLDDLTKKISVADIKSIATGKDCPLYTTRRKNQFAFSLMLESGKTDALSLDFVALDEETFYIWQDGIKVLLSTGGSTTCMTSELAERHINMLLDMEIKLQLLDVEGVAIPSQLPPIPPLPPNYNFCYNL